MPKLSVIIPVHNTEKYLKKCLDSIINQTHTDIEIICINDGSTDNSLGILEEYATKDKRIIVISQKNHGQSIARNKGIDMAKGEYIAFVDSDDYLETEHFYELLLKSAKLNDADIAKGQYKQNSDGSVETFINEQIKKDKNNFCLEFCSAIYRNSLIKNNNIRFPNYCDMEDPIFAFYCSILSNKVIIVENANYMIVNHKNSATRKYPDYHRIQDKINGLQQIVSVAEKFKVSEKCYGYVIGLLFASIYFAISRNNNILTRKIADFRLKKIWNNIKYPLEFKYNVQKYNYKCYIKFNTNLINHFFSFCVNRSHYVYSILGIKFKFKRAKDV